MTADTLVAVKTSSEAVDDIKLSQVLEHQMPLRELVELMMPGTGSEVPRIQRLLRTGSIVRHMIRYRWKPLTISEEELQTVLGELGDHGAA